MKLFKRKNVLAKVLKKNKVAKNYTRVAKNVADLGRLSLVAIPVVFLVARRTWRKENEKREKVLLKKCQKAMENQ